MQHQRWFLLRIHLLLMMVLLSSSFGYHHHQEDHVCLGVEHLIEQHCHHGNHCTTNSHSGNGVCECHNSRHNGVIQKNNQIQQVKIRQILPFDANLLTVMAPHFFPKGREQIISFYNPSNHPAPLVGGFGLRAPPTFLF